MYRIGFDAKRAFKNFSGLGNYSRSLISALSQFYTYNHYYLYTPEYKENPLLDFAQRSNIKIVTPKGLNNTFSSLWRRSNIMNDIKRDNLDLFHGLSGEIPLGSSAVPTVVTIHDAIFMRYPSYYKRLDRWMYQRKFEDACKRADKIIAISKQTADDCIKYFNADASKIEIVYQGCDPQFYDKPSIEDIARVKQKYNLADRFILSVGTIEERKNLENIVKALPYVPADTKLVAIGRATIYTAKVIATIKLLGLEDRVKFIHNADFRDFPAIYAQSKILLYTSLFEGFGIPVLEGLNSGIPVITSDVSSMPEAGGDAAMYVNPMDHKDIADKIDTLLSSPTLCATMVEKGYKHAQDFREDKVADRVFDIYQSVIEKK